MPAYACVEFAQKYFSLVLPDSPIVMVAIVILVCGLAVVSYEFLEKPIGIYIKSKGM